MSPVRSAAAPPPRPPPAEPQPIDYARPLFVEDQRFTQWWLWIVLVLPAALAAGVIVFLAWRGLIWTSPGRKLLLAMALPLAVPVLFAVLRMNVVLTGQRLTVRFFPVRRRIDVADIRSFRPLTYTLRDFGGWGMKRAKDGSMVLNVSGDRAIRINRRSGKSLIIGTQRAEAFAAALEALGVAREPD